MDKELTVCQRKTKADVVIGGKVITLSGYESREYIQRVASYLDNKLNEYKKKESYSKMPVEFKNILIQLDIADEYFKAKSMADTLEGDLESKDNEIYDLKHQLIELQSKYDNMQLQYAELDNRQKESQNELTELSSKNAQFNDKLDKIIDENSELVKKRR